ncbi:MAG: class I SAM-dependent methyltransferase [Dehalococcoidia bacterium]|nr:class I SAM-dependent methyltransferase [Dehalococcoidia bacterium]
MTISRGTGHHAQAKSASCRIPFPSIGFRRYNTWVVLSIKARRYMAENRSARPAQDQFGRQAAFYAESVTFRHGESLDAVAEFAALGRYARVVDLGTGPGFTAFIMAPYSQHVLATDIAPGMLVQARRLMAGRRLDNVGLMLAEAESLPFTPDSLDAVTSRQAAHHFHALPRAVAEVWRVLKPGAPLY